MGGLFLFVVRGERKSRRRGFLLIRAQFVPHLAYSQLICDRFFNLLIVILHRSEFGPPNPANICNLITES